MFQYKTNVNRWDPPHINCFKRKKLMNRGWCEKGGNACLQTP